MSAATDPCLRDILFHEAAYHRGMHDGLLWVANQLEAAPAQTPEPQPAEPSFAQNTKPEEYRDREPTKRPLLDLLRGAHGAMTVTELMVLLRERGMDPIRPSVTKALGNLVREGHAYRSKNGRYRIAAD